MQTHEAEFKRRAIKRQKLYCNIREITNAVSEVTACAVLLGLTLLPKAWYNTTRAFFIIYGCFTKIQWSRGIAGKYSGVTDFQGSKVE